MNFQMNITRLRIPTGRRQTSWLQWGVFTSTAEKLNSGLPRTTSGVVVRAGFESAIYGFQIRRSNHSAMLPPRRQRGWMALYTKQMYNKLMPDLCQMTYTVFLRAKLSACSGIPYTCSTPGNEISKPTEQGPWNIKTTQLQCILLL